MSIKDYEKLVSIYNPYHSKYSISALRQFDVEPTYSILKLTYDTYKKKYVNVSNPIQKKKGGSAKLSYIPIIVI